VLKNKKVYLCTLVEFEVRYRNQTLSKRVDWNI